MDLNLQGKVALVTGSSRGIGFASAQRFAQEGASVAISGRDGAALTKAKQTLEAAGAAVHATQVDLIAPGGVEQFVTETVARFGRLDCVVANVGGTQGGNFLDSTDADWMRTFELNLLHAVRVTRACTPHLAAAGGGSVVIIASISGFKPGPRAQYGASKAGEILLASSLARELAVHHVRVNAVSPGSILFEGGSWERRMKEMPEKLAEFVSREFPHGRMGTLDEVADAVVFLSSPRASWISGTNLVIDGAQGQPSIRL